MKDMKSFFMEPKHDNFAVDSFLGLGMENMGLISSKMEEFSLGLDFSFLPDDYGNSVNAWMLSNIVNECIVWLVHDGAVFHFIFKVV